MKLRFAASTLFLAMALSATAFAANQVLLRYLDIGDQGTAQVLAADTAGNLFTVSTITDPSGHSVMRVVKTDPKGGALASIDFPPSATFYGKGPAAAATDPQGNFVI